MASQTIAAAGNTEVPAYLTLIKLGYEIDRQDVGNGELWNATKGTLRLVADSPLQLLGLALLYSERGADWCAADDEIDAFLKRFGLSGAASL